MITLLWKRLDGSVTSLGTMLDLIAQAKLAAIFSRDIGALVADSTLVDGQITIIESKESAWPATPNGAFPPKNASSEFDGLFRDIEIARTLVAVHRALNSPDEDECVEARDELERVFSSVVDFYPGTPGTPP